MSVVKLSVITLSAVSVTLSLSRLESSELAAVASKMKLNFSPLVTPVVSTFRLRLLKPAIKSSTLIENSSLPPRASPEKRMAPALGASMRKVSSAEVPVTSTSSVVPGVTASSLLNKPLTESAAVTLSRTKLASPAASTLIVIAPVAEPRKLITPAVSLKLKLGRVMAAIASVRVATSV